MEKKMNHEAEILDDDMLEQANGGAGFPFNKKLNSADVGKNFGTMRASGNGGTSSSINGMDITGKVTEIQSAQPGDTSVSTLSAWTDTSSSQR